jgi:hypothetical protein
MTVGKPEFNLNSFGIRYVKKDDVDTSKLPTGKTQESHTLPTGSTPSTEKTPHGLDKPKDSLDLAGDSPFSNREVDTTVSYGEGNRTTPSMDKPLTGTSGNPNQTPSISGSVTNIRGGGKPTSSDQKTTHSIGSGTAGDKVNTGDRARMTGIGGTRKNPNADASGNEVNFKKPEGETLPKNAAMQLAIIKCKLLKMKASWTGSGSPYPKPTEPEIKEKGTGDKIPREKLGDLPQGKDDRKVESSTIVDEEDKERKYTSPADRYKAEVRKMAVDAIDEAMKNIETYQDAKEKALQEELIKDAAANTSDNGSVNFVYSDVKEKQVKKE